MFIQDIIKIIIKISIIAVIIESCLNNENIFHLNIIYVYEHIHNTFFNQ